MLETWFGWLSCARPGRWNKFSMTTAPLAFTPPSPLTL
jgi:hypothetical protein